VHGSIIIPIKKKPEEIIIEQKSSFLKQTTLALDDGQLGLDMKFDLQHREE
jgi:hypothetical protein